VLKKIQKAFFLLQRPPNHLDWLRDPLSSTSLLFLMHISLILSMDFLCPSLPLLWIGRVQISSIYYQNACEGHFPGIVSGRRKGWMGKWDLFWAYIKNTNSKRPGRLRPGTEWNVRTIKNDIITAMIYNRIGHKIMQNLDDTINAALIKTGIEFNDPLTLSG
jgi:hypothetical protein